MKMIFSLCSAVSFLRLSLKQITLGITQNQQVCLFVCLLACLMSFFFFFFFFFFLQSHVESRIFQAMDRSISGDDRHDQDEYPITHRLLPALDGILRAREP